MKFLSLIAALLIPSGAWAISLGDIPAKIRSHNCETGMTNDLSEFLFVIGLGNYGYENTRHNFGDEVIFGAEMSFHGNGKSIDAPDTWMTYQAKDIKDAEQFMKFMAAASPRLDELTVHYRTGGRIHLAPEDSPLRKVVFVHPFYDINGSGEFVGALVKELGLKPEQLLVVYDDIGLNQRQIATSKWEIGSVADGHNGVKSINEALQKGAYHRLRIGISRPKKDNPEGITLSDWVLGAIPKEDKWWLLSKGEAFRELFLNYQLRQEPGANIQKLTGEETKILKQKLNRN